MLKKYHKFSPLSQKYSINELILITIYFIAEKRETCTFERITKECFVLFPQSFAFSQYPQWPDSRKIDWTLRALRKKKLITGDPKSFFSLTKLGKKTAGEIARTFKQRRLKI